MGEGGPRDGPLPPLRLLNLLLVHGAGEEPAVWDGWDGWAVDLQAGLNVEEASLLNYEAAVACDAGLVERPLCLVGRGMGALVALLAARRIQPAAVALVDPWPPEVPSAEATRPESPLALDECRRGIQAPRPDAPVLVVSGPADPYAVSAWARSASP